MARELFISIYLSIFSFLFKFFNIFPMQKKVVFCASFIENNAFLYSKLKKLYPETAAVLLNYNKSCFHYFSHHQKKDDIVLFFNPKKIFSFLASIYHLATAKVVIMDNYYAFLSSVQFKREVKRLQIWHAVGAIKTFGLKDSSIKDRSKKANERFLKVYNQFEHTLVGSNKMENIFKEAFGLPSSSFIRTGIPRTDLFFDDLHKNKIITELYDHYPELRNKKVILYAPTFRDGQIDHYTLPINLAALKKTLGKEYIFVLKLHPAIKTTFDYGKQDSFILDLSDYPKVNDLLFITDYLITDYSSIPFEFSYFQKPMLFYPYDLEEYMATRGLWEPYSDLVPGPIVHSSEDIAHTILNNSFDLYRIEKFHKAWNEYSNGDSSKKAVLQIHKWLKED